MEFVLLDEKGEPFWSTLNEQELQFALEYMYGKPEIWYYHENEDKTYKKENYGG